MEETPVTLSQEAIARLLPSIDALHAMRQLFEALGNGQAAQPPQTLTLFPDGSGDFITYLGALTPQQVFGAKLSPYIQTPSGGLVTAWTLLMSMQTGRPLLLCDSKALTTERTAATTALAVDLLAPRDCSRLTVIGSGAVARAHIRHVQSLRNWRDIRVHSRSLSASPDLHPTLLALDPRVRLEYDLTAASFEADVILLCTSSGTPVIDPAHLEKPALITSISTNAPKAREIPPSALKAMDVYCDFRATTPSSAGEMQIASAEHGWSADLIRGDLPDLVLGRAVVPKYDRHAYFRSIGLGLEDIAMAEAIYRRTRSPEVLP